MDVQGWPAGTVIRGNVVMWQGQIEGEPTGRRLRFSDMICDMRKVERA
jgi:dihydroorotase